MNTTEQTVKIMMETPRKVRGTATIFATGDVEFRAQGEGKPQKRVLMRLGNSQLYETTSEQSPQLCAHLLVNRSDPQAPARLQAQLDEFLESFHATTGTERPVRLLKKDRELWNDSTARVVYKASEGCVRVSLTLPLKGQQTLEKTTMNEFKKLYQCFAINKVFLHNAYLALKKTGNA